jgi:hypothetical protein
MEPARQPVAAARGSAFPAPSDEKARDEASRFITSLYLGILRREPDAAGLKQHTESLLAGRTHAEIADDFLTSAEFGRQLAAKGLFRPPGHFYSPIVDPVEAGRHLDAMWAKPLPAQLPAIALDRSEMVAAWRNLLPFLSTVPFLETKRRRYRFFFDNPTYSWGDGSVLHAMVRRHKPKRLMEIGSGYSSACTLDTVEHYLKWNCELTFIEPHAQLLRKIVGKDTDKVRIFEMPVQQIPLSEFDRLQENDILFIDSTHVMRTGSDVCFELFEILPRLASGVLVHFHDIFWPFEYGRSWAVDENRSWNEAYAVRAFLSHNSAWKIVMFNDYLAKLERDLIEKTFPAFLRNTGGALWLRRV